LLLPKLPKKIMIIKFCTFHDLLAVNIVFLMEPFSYAHYFFQLLRPVTAFLNSLISSRVPNLSYQLEQLTYKWRFADSNEYKAKLKFYESNRKQAQRRMSLYQDRFVYFPLTYFSSKCVWYCLLTLCRWLHILVLCAIFSANIETS
jgi:hypothetical protein